MNLMAAITKSEIVELAFTRNVSTDHILDADLAVAAERYVSAYIADTVDVTSSFYENYVKPVIAFGVAVDVMDRIAVEITDRGVVGMINNGAQIASDTSKSAIKREYQTQLNTLLKLMCDAAVTEGLELVNDQLYFTRIQYGGNERVGQL